MLQACTLVHCLICFILLSEKKGGKRLKHYKVGFVIWGCIPVDKEGSGQGRAGSHHCCSTFLMTSVHSALHPVPSNSFMLSVAFLGLTARLSLFTCSVISSVKLLLCPVFWCPWTGTLSFTLHAHRRDISSINLCMDVSMAQDEQTNRSKKLVLRPLHQHCTNFGV